MAHQQTSQLDLLVADYVASFEKLDEMIVYETDPIAQQLAVGDPDEHGFRRWRPYEVIAEPLMLEGIYSKLAARFPPIFERLVLSYRWAEVDLTDYRLIANPPGTDLSGLIGKISKDPAIWNCLSHSGYIQFGKGPDMDYDPVCFDLRSRTKDGDYRIVKIDHEEILCNNRLKVVAELAPSFEQLMQRTVEQATKG